LTVQLGVSPEQKTTDQILDSYFAANFYSLQPCDDPIDLAYLMRRLHATDSEVRTQQMTRQDMLNTVKKITKYEITEEILIAIGANKLTTWNLLYTTETNTKATSVYFFANKTASSGDVKLADLIEHRQADIQIIMSVNSMRGVLPRQLKASGSYYSLETGSRPIEVAYDLSEGNGEKNGTIEGLAISLRANEIPTSQRLKGVTHILKAFSPLSRAKIQLAKTFATPAPFTLENDDSRSLSVLSFAGTDSAQPWSIALPNQLIRGK